MDEINRLLNEIVAIIDKLDKRILMPLRALKKLLKEDVQVTTCKEDAQVTTCKEDD